MSVNTSPEVRTAQTRLIDLPSVYAIDTDFAIKGIREILKKKFVAHDPLLEQPFLYKPFLKETVVIFCQNNQREIVEHLLSQGAEIPKNITEITCRANQYVRQGKKIDVEELDKHSLQSLEVEQWLEQFLQRRKASSIV